MLADLWMFALMPWKMTPSMGAGLLHSLLLKVKYHLLQQPVQPVIRIIPMYTTRRKVPDFSLVKSHACIFERRVTQTSAFYIRFSDAAAADYY